jgi:hypothetical protein
MRIAVATDPMLLVPLQFYGGTERIIDMIVRRLVNRGHETTLFTYSDSNVHRQLVSCMV